jgi:hypothetical protein
MDADLEREILRVDAERVEADRLENRVPLLPAESSLDVVAGERVQVADVQPLRGRIGKHHQLVVGPLAVLQVRGIGPLLPPPRLPLLLDG